MNRFLIHFQMYTQRDLAALRHAGFTPQQIMCFGYLRKNYQLDAQDRPVYSQNYLLFVRWLVQQGKLNEELR